jgi:putative transposase
MLRGEPYVLRRAVDHHGAETASRQGCREAFLQTRTRRVSRWSAQHRHRPAVQLSGGKGRNPRARQRQPRVGRASARVNNRAENSHQLTRERERCMRGFRLPERTRLPV